MTAQINPEFAQYFSTEDMAQSLIKEIDPALLVKTESVKELSLFDLLNPQETEIQDDLSQDALDVIFAWCMHTYFINQYVYYIYRLVIHQKCYGSSKCENKFSIFINYTLLVLISCWDSHFGHNVYLELPVLFYTVKFYLIYKIEE